MSKWLNLHSEHIKVCLKREKQRVKHSLQDLRHWMVVPRAKNLNTTTDALPTKDKPKKPAPTPAKAAGLKKGDVVLAVAGNRVNSRAEFEKQCRQYKSGEEVELTIVRDRKDQPLTITFGDYPEGARSPFTGTLGGQAADLQDLQGEDGHEYGGLYKSEDGGETWARINTLNPRPMYYSQIRIDPSNSDNIMVCGTSLYRSTDGGKTFDRSAGRGMHVDHHAQWIDPNDGDHIIHGCDGGVHVTYDAGKNWDQLNHVAIGQFYHVGVSSDRNYRVYGGLQDNGSWGGPSRTSGAAACRRSALPPRGAPRAAPRGPPVSAGPSPARGAPGGAARPRRVVRGQPERGQWAGSREQGAARIKRVRAQARMYDA